MSDQEQEHNTCPKCGALEVEHHFADGERRECRDGKLAWDRAESREWLEGSAP